MVMATRPAAIIEWFIDGIHQPNGARYPVSLSSMQNDDLVDTTSVLSFLPGLENQNQTVLCKATIHATDAPYAQESVRLDVIG